MNEALKIKNKVMRYCSGKGVDIGCKNYKLLPDMVGIDQDPHHCVDRVADVSESIPCKDEEFDFVFSSHCLEDIYDTKKALTEWLRILKKDGYIILYLPHKYLYKGFNSEHVHEFIPMDVMNILDELDVEITEVHEENGKNDMYSFLIVGKK